MNASCMAALYWVLYFHCLFVLFCFFSALHNNLIEENVVQRVKFNIWHMFKVTKLGSVGGGTFGTFVTRLKIPWAPLLYYLSSPHSPTCLLPWVHYYRQPPSSWSFATNLLYFQLTGLVLIWPPVIILTTNIHVAEVFSWHSWHFRT